MLTMLTRLGDIVCRYRHHNLSMVFYHFPTRDRRAWHPYRRCLTCGRKYQFDTRRCLTARWSSSQISVHTASFGLTTDGM